MDQQVQSKPIRRGDLVRVFQKISEGKRDRVVPWPGKVVRVKGDGDNKMITVRQYVDGVMVEKIFPFYHQSIVKIEKVVERKMNATSRKKAAKKNK